MTASAYGRLTPRMAWQLAAPHTWPAAILPVLVAAAAAAVTSFSISATMVCVLLVICVLMQSAVNTFNDYYDYVKGADSADDNVDPTDAVLVYNNVNPRAALALAVGFLAAAFLLGAYVIWIAGWIPLAIGAAGAVVVVAAVVLTIPKARTWAWAKIEPTYRQVWPRLVWVMSNPMRLALGVGGALTLSLSYILSFSASLWAFGYTVPFAVLAITYLASNTVGSIVPSPGGIGPVELALTAGLVAAGVPYGVALSTAIVYRLVTFWIPIPVGWLSLQRLQKVGDL